MPTMIIVSKAEADFLRDEKVEGIDGYAFTYNVKDTATILAQLDKQHDTYPAFSGRLAGIASQLGVADVMFGSTQAPRIKQPQVDLEELFGSTPASAAPETAAVKEPEPEVVPVASGASFTVGPDESGQHD